LLLSSLITGVITGVAAKSLLQHMSKIPVFDNVMAD
jgi:hypothetical protein